ncbi:hypothetical protein DY102_01335 [Apilactobacillus timberlakei]|uniref:hypothetical protein n=1 Tax=Apilactobacillus timberlakei TaxID=2008380 RepID=UPI00112C0D36|nr:hypothetical protein [Apilactobacillus timberlakei]TPR25097.1 hypothetical protein DY102_01335 [Apilactobacillus timberlakei]
MLYNSVNEYGKNAMNNISDKNSQFNQNSYDNLIRKIFANPKEINDLYHYTNLESFKKILSSSQFYIGSIYSMNDPMERKYTYKMATNILKNMGATQLELNVFYEDYKSYLPDAYVLSFSANSSSQALSNYGNVAIKFDNKSLQSCLALQYTKPKFKNMVDGDGYVFPLKVEYDNEIQKTYITPIIEQWLYTFRGLKDTYNSFALEIRQECLTTLLLDSLCLKNSLLYQEEEIRYVILKRNSLNNSINPDKNINGRPFCVADFSKDMFKEIILSHKVEKHLKEIKDILKSNGFNNTAVKITNLPYLFFCTNS